MNPQREGGSVFRGNEVKPVPKPERVIRPEWTEDEASYVAAALTFCLDIVGESVPTDSHLRRALSKLVAAGKA